VELVSLGDFPDLKEIDETESTFRGNAELKASGYARQAGIWTLADDSGLEVDALGGAPGVYSARFAGAGSSYETKIAELLSQIGKAKNLDRRARFVCAMAIAGPDGNVSFTTEGRCEGAIAESPRGTRGFGYDPVFVPDGFDHTFGELPGDIKQQISHRGRAAREINRYLLDFIEV
jgi:XTP/dITP diphosphohydrolase